MKHFAMLRLPIDAAGYRAIQKAETFARKKKTQNVAESNLNANLIV